MTTNDTETPTSVLVLWADPTRNLNLGVRVLAEGTAELIRRAWGDDVQIQFQDFGPGDTKATFGTKAILRNAVPTLERLSDVVADYDVIVDTGAGDSFTDSYGWARFLQMTLTQKALIKSGKFYVFGPQTVGPFNSRIATRQARAVLGRASLIMVRDSISDDVAQEISGRETVSSPDVVFALDSPKTANHRGVVINISGLLWSPNNHVDYRIYRNQMLEMTDLLVESGHPVTLLAHVLGSDGEHGDNDIPAANWLSRNASGGPLEVVIPSSLSDARARLGSADIVIASRMHACLNAISMGTPAIPLAYSRKFEPLLNDLGWTCVFDLRTGEPFSNSIAQLVSDTNQVAMLRNHALKVNEVAETRLEVAVSKLREEWLAWQTH